MERPPSGSGWLHEIKFDGYRVQLRVQGGQVTLRTRKGLDWTAKFGAIADEAKSLPDAIIDGEIVALDQNGAPDFAALQAALSEQRTDRSGILCFRSAVRRCRGPAALPLTERKARLEAMLSARKVSKGARIRFVEHFETGGDAVLRSACKLSLEGIVSKTADAPYRSGRTETWTKAKCRAGHEVVIGGWTTTKGKFRSLLVGVHRRRPFRLCRPRRYRIQRGEGQTAAAAAEGRWRRASRLSPAVGAPRKEPNINWAEAGTRRRDRVRRLDRRRHGPAGRLQGSARGQAGGRGRGREAGSAREMRLFPKPVPATDGQAPRPRPRSRSSWAC